MPNMRTVSQDERAKMARAYMRGGMAPYQAARNTGFCRVGLMQEAIRAMEGREAEEASPRAAQYKYGLGPATVEEAVAEKPVESAEDEAISLPEDTVAELCEDDEPETPQTVYPFLKPGEVKTAGVLMTLQTERLMIRLYEKNGRQLFQVTERRTGHYLELQQQVVRELKNALGLCLGAMNMQQREGVSPTKPDSLL